MTETILRLLAVVILLVSAIISALGNLPWWVVLILALLFVALPAPKAYRWFSSILRKRGQQRREQKLVERHWQDLTRLATELQAMTESSRMEIIGTIFDLAMKVAPEKQDYYNPQGLKSGIHFLLISFLSLLDSQVRNKNAFTSSAQLLERLFWFWHHEVITKLARNLRKDLEVAKYSVNQYQKENYNKTRKWHTDLMDDYVRFAKAVNADFSNRVLRVTLYEPLPDVWQG